MFRILLAIPVVMCMQTVGAASPVSAQDHRSQTVSVTFAQDGEGQSVRTRSLVLDDGTEVLIELRGEEMKVWLNGEAVPQDRLQRQRNRVSIFDDEGNAIMQVPILGERPPRAPRPLRAPRAFERGAAPAPGGGVPPIPRGQIGIGLGRIDAALGAHLQLDPDEVILITFVRENAPAARAGLQSHDIILAIDGESPATQQRLRQAVRDREPGDQLVLRVLRAGEKKDITVEIGPFERSSPEGRSGVWHLERGQADWRQFDAQELAEMFQEQLSRGQRQVQRHLRHWLSEEQLEELGRRLREDFERSFDIEGLDQELREKVLELHERYAEQARQAIERLELERIPRLEREWLRPGIEFFRDEDGTLKGLFMRSPDAPQPPRAVNLERLERRLERLERQLERMEEMLNRLVAER